jgi:hypothetical protein
MFTEKSVFKPSGLLFIGDPHVCSTSIGRRKDDYTKSVLGKLTAAAVLCHEKHLIPVITGDLMHRNDDSAIRMLNGLMRVLKSFPVPPIVLEGNHDRELTELSDSDVLMLLAQTGVVRLTGTGLVEVFDFEGAAEEVRLWACPYGAAIPGSLPAFKGKTVLLTHHDMAFGSAYPGAAPLSRVEHCDMVVNGHMHDTKKSVLVGDTWWHNPGNIEPLSVDLVAHIPRAWEWRPGQDTGALLGHELPHRTDVFDMAGLVVLASDAEDSVKSLPAVESSFAAMLDEQSTTEAARTADKSVLVEDLAAVLDAQNASDPIRKLMFALAAGAGDGELVA